MVTNDSELRTRLQVFRDHGQARKYFHSVVGWNARMDGIQAAVLQVKLKGLQAANDARRAHARHYDALLAGEEQVITPFQSPAGRHVYHVYAVRVRERDRILRALADRGIACGIHYPVPVHLQEAYRSLGHAEGSFPVTEKCAREFLSLPMYPELRPDQVETVVEELRACIPGRLRKAHECAA